jgi:hypothetical protein
MTASREVFDLVVVVTDGDQLHRSFVGGAEVR